jgi:hypothetical protein
LPKTLALDAHILMLLAVGVVDVSYISRHKRLHPVYAPIHFHVLQDVLAQSRAVATTTHALTEASNLLRQCREPMRSEIMVALAGIIATIEELTPAASDVCLSPEFIRLGLTDAAFGRLDPARHEIISADRDLVAALQTQGFQVINFHDLLF